MKHAARRQPKEYGSNLADEYLSVFKGVCDDDFVRVCLFRNGRVPCIFLYFDEQIDNIKHLCVDKANRSRLSFDTTYNLGKVIVINQCVYSHEAILRRGQGECTESVFLVLF